MNEYYAVVRSTDELAHYGVKGMNWGVRKALASGNERALNRHFRKAAKKLKKLQDIGTNSKKYAAKAAAYGAAAAGTGTIAVVGTEGLASVVGRLAKRYSDKSKIAAAMARDVKDRKAESILKKKSMRYNAKSKRAKSAQNKITDWGKERKAHTEYYIDDMDNASKKTVYGLSNNDKLRIGAAAATIGLAGKAAQNAYRASHGAQYRQKAHEFKNAMDEAFSGTKYSGIYTVPPRSRKRKKSRRG
ncbi:MAG: hypothetical protein J6Y48_20330 [Clostridia bacterium]|nr:hypothetical protein [Clostridia bacterium]